jgi:hypothetical protein
MNLLQIATLATITIFHHAGTKITWQLLRIRIEIINPSNRIILDSLIIHQIRLA